MHLRQKIVSAVGWSIGIKTGFQLVTWAMTLFVIRILSPQDYGLMAITQLFINFMIGFSNVGLGDALIQQEYTPKSVISSAFGVTLLISVFLTLLFILLSYPIAAWYEDARLTSLIQVASLGFLFNGLMILPRVYMTKNMRIPEMFILELSSSLFGAVTVIVMAYEQYGVWSLMLGTLVGNVARLIGFVLLTKEYYIWPSLDINLVRPLFSYSKFRTLEYLTWIAFTSSDTLILSQWITPAELGIYTVAMNFAVMPLNKIAPIINSIAFPAFAMLQRQPIEARLYALKAMRVMAAVAVPIFFGISAVAPELVAIVFGAQWAAAGPILTTLSLAITFRAILLVIPNYLQGLGNAKAGFWCTASALIIFVPAFLVGCHWGIFGVGIAWLCGYPVVFVMNVVISAHQSTLNMKKVLMVPLEPIIAGTIMFISVKAFRYGIYDQSALIRLLALSAFGAATYLLVVFLFFRSLALEVTSLIRAMPSRATNSL